MSCTHGLDCPRKVREDRQTPEMVAALETSHRLVREAVALSNATLEAEQSGYGHVIMMWVKRVPMLVLIAIYVWALWWLGAASGAF